MLDRLLRPFAFLRVNQAMVDVIVDQRALRAGDRVLDRLKLLRDVHARSLLLDHGHDAAKVAGRPVKALDDRGVAGVRCVGHFEFLTRHDGRVHHIPHGG